MLEKTDLVRIAELAFSPLKCKAELPNYEHAFGFGVHLPDGTILKYEAKNASLLQNETLLYNAISGVRSQIERLGISLGPWAPPSQG